MATLREFEAYQISHVTRTENVGADILSKLVHDSPEHISKVAQITEASSACIEASLVEPVEVGEDP